MPLHSDVQMIPHFEQQFILTPNSLNPIICTRISAPASVPIGDPPLPHMFLYSSAWLCYFQVIFFIVFSCVCLFVRLSVHLRACSSYYFIAVSICHTITIVISKPPRVTCLLHVHEYPVQLVSQHSTYVPCFCVSKRGPNGVPVPFPAHRSPEHLRSDRSKPSRETSKDDHLSGERLSMKTVDLFAYYSRVQK